MDPFGNAQIARLLRLKRYEQPSPDYFKNFLHEFRRRQRDELLRQPPWRICFQRAQGFAAQYDVRSLLSYAAGITAVVACAAVISSTIYQQPDTTHFAAESSPVPTKSPNTKKAPSGLIRPCEVQPAVLLPNSRNIRILPVRPVDLLRSDEFVPLKLKWESLDDQPLLEKYRGEER